jgi:hypothetical protein
VENRVLPAGPTIVDTLANAAFYYGLVRVLVEDERPVWSQMSFSRRGELLRGRERRHRRARVLAGRRRGAGGRARAAPLLPMARDGLARWGVDAADADRLLEIIERRCVGPSTARPGRPRPFHRSTTAWTAPTPCAR